MALDPNIILSGKPVQLADPMALTQGAMQIRNLGLAGQSADLQLQQQRKQQADSAALAQIYRQNIGPDGTINHQGVIQGLANAGLGDQIPAYQEQAAKAGKEQTGADAAQLSLHQQRLGIVNNVLHSLLSKPDINPDGTPGLTSNDVIAALVQLSRDGPTPQTSTLTPDQAAQMARMVPGNPAQLRPFLAQKGLEALDAQKQVEAQLALAPKYNEQNRGNVINEGTVDPMTGQRTPGKDVAVGISPGDKARLDFQKSGALTDDAKSLMVDRLLAGEKPSQVLGNLGRGQQGAADLRDVQNLLATTAKARGMSGAQITGILQDTAAAGRTMMEIGAREGKIAPRVQEAINFAGIAKTASAAVPRGKFLPWNKLSQMSDTQMSDPALAKLKAATVSLINAYAAAVGGGQIHVHDQETATGLLNAAQSQEAYNAVVDQLLTESEGALNAPGQVAAGIKAARGSAVPNGGARPPLSAFGSK